MMTHQQVRAALARMEDSLAETRANIAAIERHMARYAENETMRRRPKKRLYRRSSTRWSGADEHEYHRVLETLSGVTFVELERLERRAARQDRAIAVLRCKYCVQSERPRFYLP